MSHSSLPCRAHHRLSTTLLILAGFALSLPARAQLSATTAPARTEYVTAATPLAAGEYLTTIGGCNDCHTQGWAESNGKTPSAERFTGSNVGYRGPWGTTYAANLRLVTQRHTEDEWVKILTTADEGHGKPPMPWMNTAATSDRDLRAMYRYIRSLGPRGERAPRAVKPGETPKTPSISFEPVMPTP